MSSSGAQQTVLTHSAVKGIQSFALLSPPLLLARALIARRAPSSLGSSLRSLTLGTFVVGPAAGGLVEFGRLYWQGLTEGELGDKAARIRANEGQRRADDYATIGAVLGSLIAPTLLFRRAPLPWIIGSGASLGVAGGVLTHVAKGYSEGEDTLSPQMVKEEVKGAVGAKGK
ncbi:hypothetical protein JCM6882_009462 [Rhodosporidiobolus microsporus]